MDDSNNSSDGDNVYKERMEPMLVLLSDSYSDDNNISVCDSRPFSYFAYIITDYYCPNQIVNNFSLRRLFYSKWCCKNNCCSST